MKRPGTKDFIYGSPLGTIPFEAVFGDNWSKHVAIQTQQKISYNMRRIWTLIDPFYKSPEVVGMIEVVLKEGNEKFLFPLFDYVMDNATQEQKLQIGDILMVVRVLLNVKKKFTKNYMREGDAFQTSQLFWKLRMALELAKGKE